jgi:hypothetical protein
MLYALCLMQSLNRALASFLSQAAYDIERAARTKLMPYALHLMFDVFRARGAHQAYALRLTPYV